MKKIISLLLSASLVFMLAITLTSCGGCENLGTGSCEYTDSRDISGRDIHYVEMCVEGYGKVVILLDATTAPITVSNFLKLVNEGFYDGLTFHRIIEGFMIQGGDPKADGTGNSSEQIKGEFSENGYVNDIDHIKGVISMARGGHSMDSASCQFFICNADARASLDGKYAAFGYVVEGLDIIDEITTGALNDCLAEFGRQYGEQLKEQYFYYWLYYGNGLMTDDYGLRDVQPVIKHIREIDSWEK